MGQEITEGQVWVHESMAYLHETCHMAWRCSRSTPYKFPKTTGLQRHFSVQEPQTGLSPFTGTYQPPMPTRVSWYLLYQKVLWANLALWITQLDVEIWVGTPPVHHMESIWTHTHTHTHTALHLYGFTSSQNNPVKKAKQVLSSHPTSEKSTLSWVSEKENNLPKVTQTVVL